ncbi:uncharacterized protein LOC131005354 [Salvia miltiorrhiza]|uniref:uncharacterized protein LOC131005354 n=1 Tax=Salvia miltiorrhiza TaxID=226208 RepID=UPI0025AC9ECE|nr:uncharacterized protein LOC131005354 [Salvia miltiorrhiza]XP_057788262.1 uncharacterized protein LOC131005354 [Salvia miltiorrhiza]
MLNGVVQPVNDAIERSRQTVQPYQSLWLAHWKRTDCDAAGDSTSPSASRSEELDYVARKDGLAKGVETSSRSATVGLTKKRTFDIGDDFITIGGRSIGNDRVISSLDDQNTAVLSRLNPLKGSFVESHVSPEEYGIETYKFDKGKAVASVSSSQRSANMRILEHEQCCERRETDLLCERKVGSTSRSNNSSDECLRDSISCDHCLPMINRAWFLKMQKSSGIRLSPSQSNSSEENETTKSHIDSCSHLKLQKCDHGLGTMRIRTGVEVPGGMGGRFPWFSETNNDLLMKKKTDVNAFKENDTFRSKRVTSKINGNLSDDLCSVLPFFGQNKQTLPLHALSSLNNSEVKEYMRDVKASTVTIGNELSAETDTMDMDSLKEKKYEKSLRSGISASISTAALLTKAFNTEPNDIVSSREIGHGRLNNELPDIIKSELPALPGAASSPQHTCPSSSKTLTLETDELLEHVKHPKAKLNSSPDESPHADAGNRWVKRLKLSSSKSPNYASTAPLERTSKLFNGIPRSESTPSLSKHHDKRSVLPDKSGDLLKIDDTENPNIGTKTLLLSQAWIQRWLHSGRRGGKREPRTEAIFEPEGSKSAAEKLQKEQFPSIAAMALMSKVLTCFQQCELQNKGSYTVWNTKTV